MRSWFTTGAAWLAPTAAAALFGAAAQADDDAKPAIMISDFIGVVTIQTAPDGAWDLSSTGGEGLVSAILTPEGVTVEGPGYSKTSCRTRRRSLQVRVDDGPWTGLEDFGSVTIAAPDTAVLRLKGGLVDLKAGPLGAAQIEVDGCGEARIERVSGGADVTIDGSGDAILGDVGGPARFIVDGSGDINAERVSGPLEAVVDGAGDVRVASLDGGPARLVVDGSGDVVVRGGSASALEASVDGSGDVVFDGVAGAVTASVDGSGDITIAQATGEVRTNVEGSGDIDVGR